MFKPLTIIIITATPSLAKFVFPDNANFKISYFNDSTCNTSTHYSEVNSLCLGGEDKCCPKLLREFSIEKDSKFDYCYQFNVPNSSIGSLKYDCGLSKYHGLTTEETFSFIGLILVVLLVFLFFGCCIRKFCCGRNGYDSV